MSRLVTLRWALLASCILGATLAQIGCEASALSANGATPALTAPPVALPDMAPAGYNRIIPDAPRGKLENVTYPSKSVGVDRPAVVYTPPGYDPKVKYPVIYLLHGINSDQYQWTRGGGATGIILDNLIHEKKIVPFICVMPNGNAVPNPAQATGFTNTQGYTNFEKDLLEDLIPFIDGRYSTKADRENRALAGLSMGGGQALHFGLAHPEAFAWVGGFSAAPNVPRGAQLEQIVARLKDGKDKHNLIWIGCGVSDNLSGNGHSVHTALETAGINHVYYLQEGVHDFNVWNHNLWMFSQMAFKPVGSVIPPKSPASLPAGQGAGRGGMPGGRGGAPGGRGAFPGGRGGMPGGGVPGRGGPPGIPPAAE